MKKLLNSTGIAIAVLAIAGPVLAETPNAITTLGGRPAAAAVPAINYSANPVLTPPQVKVTDPRVIGGGEHSSQLGSYNSQGVGGFSSLQRRFEDLADAHQGHRIDDPYALRKRGALTDFVTQKLGQFRFACGDAGLKLHISDR